MRKIISVLLIVSAVLLICSSCGLRSANESPFDKADDTTANVAETETTATATEAETTVPETTAAETRQQLETANFKNCLFIGDSRTVGLGTFSDLGEATVFAATGLNVFRIFTDTVTVEGIGDTTLSALLASKEYANIYLMLGINEIGYNHQYVINEYGNVVSKICEAQPNATLYIMANLHIVKSRSDTDNVYNNAGMNELNNGMKNYANGTTIKYLDANPLFDDEYGALDSQYTADDFHLLGEHYQKWADWISENSLN